MNFSLTKYVTGGKGSKSSKPVYVLNMNVTCVCAHLHAYTCMYVYMYLYLRSCVHPSVVLIVCQHKMSCQYVRCWITYMVRWNQKAKQMQTQEQMALKYSAKIRSACNICTPL